MKTLCKLFGGPRNGTVRIIENQALELHIPEIAPALSLRAHRCHVYKRSSPSEFRYDHASDWWIMEGDFGRCATVAEAAIIENPVVILEAT